jgi:hypothetical protein
MYLDKDVAYFVSQSPYLTLAKPRSAARFLQRQVTIGEDCWPALRRYPRERIEPLDFFYTCLHSLGALDQPFFEALLGHHTWRGVVWGSWLALLDPREAFSKPLRAAAPGPHNQWIVDAAMATIDGRDPPPEGAEIAALAARFRDLLEGVPRPEVPLRHAPTPTEIAVMDGERALVRARYARGGADAALAALRGTLVGFYAQGYVRWVRARNR